MGYSQASKAQTHQRVVQAAAAQFRQNGIDGISLADLMKELGLTHGGFYKHFGSRDELVAEAIDYALEDSEQTMRELLFKGGKPNLARYLKTYLSETHRDSRATGCSFTALAGDVARKGEALQTAMAEQIERNLELVGEALDQVRPDQRRNQALLLLSTLYGALMMARTVGDSALSREILRSVRDVLLAKVNAVPDARTRSRAD
ncbi:MAG: hypothetical protein JWR16_3333 [Nevskia sp.]|nr:hypothetical protein [Nevskia sp.]